MTVVSVIIPAHRRPASLRACLEAIRDQDLPAGVEVEVIVVDDGGDVPLERVIDAIEGLDVLLLRQDHLGPASARNLGADKATGDLLLFTDDDCTPSRGWIAAMLARTQRTPDAMVAGRTVSAADSSAMMRVSDAITAHLIDWAADHRTPPFATANNLAVPAARFAQLDGFDETFTTAAADDRDLAARWAGRGWPLASAPDAVVERGHQLTPTGFVREHHRYGRGARHHAEQATARGADPGLFRGLAFYAALLARVLREVGPVGVPLLLIAQLSTALGYAQESRA